MKDLIIIGAVVLVLAALLAYLIRQNSKDEKKVTEHFNDLTSDFHGDDDELNDAR